MMEDEKNICQQLIAIADEFCDKYCKYPDMYLNKDPKADVDMLEETMYTEICSKCPMRLMI